MISNTEFTPIAELDLDPIKVKLMHKESGEGWSLEHANAMEFEYRRFLCLMKMFPHEQTAPLFDVDIFWHYHILDTMKYAADCDKVFGYFMHHFPYLGLRGEDDEAAHQGAGARMQELYEATFGEPYIRPGAGQAVAAWSTRVAAQPAWSTRVAVKTAWSTRVVPQTAWSTRVAAKTAWSTRVAATAWSTRVDEMASPGAQAAQIASGDQAAGSMSDRFYSERPLLAKAA